MKFKDRNAVITGGDSGIGRAIAIALAEQGVNILFTYNTDESSSNEVIQEILKFGVKVKALKIDLLYFEQIEYLKNKSNEYFHGEVNILINNAGTLFFNPFLTQDKSEIMQVLDLNLKAPLFLIQEFAKLMVIQQKSRADELKKDYCIINITSISRKVIVPGLAPYELTKAALHQLTKSLAVDPDFLKYGIRINDIAPGLTPTKINRKLWQDNLTIWNNLVDAIPQGKTCQAEEIADAAMFIIGNTSMTGATITIDGGRSCNYLGGEITTHNTDSYQRIFV